jgi:hypothetical protein
LKNLRRSEEMFFKNKPKEGKIDNKYADEMALKEVPRHKWMWRGRDEKLDRLANHIEKVSPDRIIPRPIPETELEKIKNNNKKSNDTDSFDITG